MIVEVELNRTRVWVTDSKYLLFQGRICISQRERGLWRKGHKASGLPTWHFGYSLLFSDWTLWHRWISFLMTLFLESQAHLYFGTIGSVQPQREKKKNRNTQKYVLIISLVISSFRKWTMRTTRKIRIYVLIILQEYPKVFPHCGLSSDH